MSSTPLQPGQGEEVWPIEDYMPIGSATLVLPTPRPDNIVITGGYTYSAAAGQAVPMPSVLPVIPSDVTKGRTLWYWDGDQSRD